MVLSNFPRAEVSHSWGRHPQTAEGRAQEETWHGNMAGNTQAQTQQLNHGD